MRILVIGGGAIGRMLIHQLSLTRHEVALVARGAVAKAIRDRTSMVHTPYYTHNVWTREVYDSIAEAFATDQHYDLIVIAVKSYDTSAVARELAECHGSLAGCTILTVQNGIGNEDVLSEALHGVPIIAGALTTPVEVVSDTKIRITKDRFWIGLAAFTPYAPIQPARCALKKAGFTVRVFPDPQALKCTKLLMNLMANATSAILRWTPAQVFADKRIAALEIRMIREALAVMHGLDIPVVTLDVLFLALLVRLMPIPVSHRIIGPIVVKARGDKMPSLFYDVARGRSEVGWLNGMVVYKAHRLGIPAPVNTALTEVLGDILHTPGLHAHFRGHPEHLLAAVDRHSAALS